MEQATMDQLFMREALRAAREGMEAGELPIGAVVALKDQTLAVAHTLERSRGRLLVHAELLALESADAISPFPGPRREAKLYTTLEPCLMCLGAAMSFFIGEIHYAAESPSDGAVALAHGWQRAQATFPAYRLPKIQGGLLRQEAIELFRIYVQKAKPGPMREWAESIAALD